MLTTYNSQVFGVGSIIYSGLEFSQYFQVFLGPKCHDIMSAILPLECMIFTFVQMYFVFLNAKVRNTLINFEGIL